MTSEIKLTQFSPGAGCGCKISPADLREIIRKVPGREDFDHLLVGCETRDDAAVFDLENGKVIISTADFFTPIVDDPWDFGRIAAANALSDIYAMGGKPLMAISILGWPLAKLPAAMAGRVIEGAVSICREAGIPLAGGHSIDISDPVFGLSVTGVAAPASIRKNSTAMAGCRLFLSKPLGMGIFSTAGKKNLLEDSDYRCAVEWMTRLNKAGVQLGEMLSVRAMTDVTGFGLLGHLLELCEGSRLNARLSFSKIPMMDHIQHYIEKNCIPGGTCRNWKSYGQSVSGLTEYQKLVLADPQTSGGLLVAVDREANDFDALAVQAGFTEIGELTDPSDQPLIVVAE